MVSEENQNTNDISNTLGSHVNRVMNTIRDSMESFNKAISNTNRILTEVSKITVAFSELAKYSQMVPPQVYDFLLKINAPLSKDEIAELEELDDAKFYVIYTRKTKGKKIYNPKFYVNKETFDSIKVLMSRNGSSVCVESKYVYFDEKTCRLDVYGFVTYMKKDSDRYRLCKYMFGRKRGPKEWEVKDLVEELSDGERVYDPKNKKSSHNWINGKIVELNKDVYESIGIPELISNEEGRFVLNSAHRM